MCPPVWGASSARVHGPQERPDDLPLQGVRAETQLGLQELARSRRARELEAHGAAIGLDDQLEGEEGGSRRAPFR